MSLLTICQNASDECMFNAPTSIISNTDPIAIQLLRLANREGKTLANDFAWQALTKEGTITLVTADQDYSLAADFNYIIPDTTWNRDNKRRAMHITSEYWQYVKAWSTISGLNLRVRIRNSELEIEQDITASENNEILAYDYVSKYWAVSLGTGSADQAEWLDDTDTSILDEELITQGVVWRFKKSKSLPDWQQDRSDYENLKYKMKSRDKGAPTINLGGDSRNLRLGVNIDDQDYGI